MIAALEKAEKLAAYARRLGAPMHEFVLLLTVAEGFELIEWMFSEEGPQNICLPVLEYDAKIARAQNDPFVVLSNFNLNGLEIRRAVETLH